MKYLHMLGFVALVFLLVLSLFILGHQATSLNSSKNESFPQDGNNALNRQVTPSLINITPYIYSAVVYIQNEKIIAIDRFGNLIVDGVAGKNDAQVVQAAIDSAAENYGSVYVASGTYLHSSKVTIKKGVSLIYEHGTRVVPASDIDLFKLQPYAQLSGVTIDTTGTKYAHSCILLDGTDHFTMGYKSTMIRDIELRGNAGTGTGTAIYFSSQDAEYGHVNGVIIENIRIYQFENGIKLYRTGLYGVNFINANTFRSIQGDNTVNFISMLHDGYAESDLDGNLFTDINYETGTNSNTAITVGGRYNRIDAMIWDWDKTNKAIVIQPGSNRNYISTDVEVKNDGDRFTNQIICFTSFPSGPVST